MPGFELADRLVTQGEWADFMRDGGYSTPSLWLSDGWSWLKEHQIEAPLYWRRDKDGWSRFTLAGPDRYQRRRPA